MSEKIIINQLEEIKLGLRNFRVRLIELHLLTITAFSALLSLNKNKYLLISVLISGIGIILTIISLIIRANRDKKELKINDQEVELHKLEISYQFTAWEYWSLIIYLLSIASFLCITFLK